MTPANPSERTLKDFAEHDWDCDADGCHGHNDGTLCTTECPVGGKPCTCGLDALILAATAHGRAQALQAVEQEAEQGMGYFDPETYLGYARIADFCRTQREGA